MVTKFGGMDNGCGQGMALEKRLNFGSDPISDADPELLSTFPNVAR